MRPKTFTDSANLKLFASVRKICQQEGSSALWRGNLATVLHRFPYAAVTFYGNSALRPRLDRHAIVPEQARGLVAGGTSASIGVLLCYPLDVVKTRLMTQTTREYDGIVDALQKIGRDEGF